MPDVDRDTATAEEVSHQVGMVVQDPSSPAGIDKAVERSLQSKREEEERDRRTTDEELVGRAIELSRQDPVRTGKQSDVLTEIGEVFGCVLHIHAVET